MADLRGAVRGQQGVRHWSRPATIAGLAVLLAAAVLYGLTLDDGLRPAELLGGDLITHQYAQVQARPSNAPGYPLYTMGGWVWFRLGRLLLGPSAHPIPILSSYSTLWALVAVALLYALCLEVTGGHWPISALCTAFYAATYFFWYYAVTTEQYASAVALTLAMIWLLWRWDRAQEIAPQALSAGALPGDRYLLGLAVLTGVGLAHQVTVLLVVPPMLWFILRRRPELLRRPQLLLACAGWALLPLLSYAYVYVRGAQHPEWRGTGEWSSAGAWFLHFVSTQQGRGELTWSLQPLWTHEFPSLVWGELTWVVLIFGLLGIATLGRRWAAMLYVLLALYLAFCWVDRLGNWYQVIMPAYPLVVLGFAALASRVWNSRARAPAGPGTRTRVAVRVVMVTGLLALIGYRFAISYPRADCSGRPDDTGLDPGWAILGDAPREEAAILGDQEETVALRYLTEIWGARADVAPVGAAEARQLLGQGERPLYATVRAAPLVWSEVSPDVHLSSAGLALIELRSAPQSAIPPLTNTVGRDLGDHLRLLGYELHVSDAQEESLPPSLSIWWQAAGEITHDWSASVRPTRAGEFIYQNGQLVQSDHRHPVHGRYPTSRWSEGEVVRDDYALSLPEGVEADGVAVLVYRPLDAGFENLAQVELSWRP
jgi:hypothetical protein